MHLINFQCYKDSGEIPINRMTIFVGENDSGKSCILRALDFFLNNKLLVPDNFRELNGHREKTCSIVLTFNPNPEEAIPKEYLVDNSVQLKKEFLLDETGTVIATLFIRRFLFEIRELNSINELKATQLKDLCIKLGVDYNGVEEAKVKLINYVRAEFDSLAKVGGFSSIKWSEISSLLPIFEYYDSSDYGNPQLHIQTTLKKYI